MSKPTLLMLAKAGEFDELKRRLERAVAEFGIGGEQMSEEEKLLDEALTFMRLGDIDEVKHLLERRAHPKWDSIEECQEAYQLAMEEKQQGATA